MSLYGVVERLLPCVAHGWVRLPKHNADPVLIRAELNGRVVGEAHLGRVREDVSTDECQGWGFTLSFSSHEAKSSHALMFYGLVGDSKIELNVWRPVDLARKINSLSESEFGVLVKGLGEVARDRLQSTVRDLRGLERNEKRPLAVISYANDSGAWFPYFLSHYSNIIETKDIFIITPKPSSFAGFNLGGVISLTDFPYDDVARSRLVSGIASGLQGYYEWTLVCDVDELVVPAPGDSRSLLEILSEESGDVIRTRGLDVVQLQSEETFDFSMPVWAQRSAAVPNTAISKPHLSRIPVVYSAGFHFASRRGSPPHNRALVTLHLKWACTRVRKEVLGIVRQTEYADAAIEDYSARSVSEDYHPLVLNRGALMVDASDDVWLDFELQSYNQSVYANEVGLFGGKLSVGNYLVSLGRMWGGGTSVLAKRK